MVWLHFIGLFSSHILELTEKREKETPSPKAVSLNLSTVDFWAKYFVMWDLSCDI